MDIIEVTELTEDILDALNELLPQLSSSAGTLSKAYLEDLVRSDSSHLLMAKEDGQYYGSLTLVVFYIPTGIRAWIEDVVVSKKARGKGVGKNLSLSAVDLAIKLGARTIDLTSRPSREVANTLYKNIGFELRETNVYRYKT